MVKKLSPSNMLSDKQRTKRADRSKYRKDNILDKAGLMFTEKGYDKTSIRELSKACGFEVGNIYNYFPSKEDILYQVFIRDMVQLLDLLHPLLEEGSSLSPIEKLKIFIVNYVTLIVGRKSRLQFEIERRNLKKTHQKKIIEMRDKIDACVNTIISEGIEKGYFREIDRKLVTYFIASIIMRIMTWYSNKGRLTPIEISNIMFDFIIKGLTTQQSSQNVK